MPRQRKKDRLPKVVRTLEDEIIFGRLQPFERLTEEEVITRFKVTRHMARQALQELELLGIVEKERHKGTMVRYFSVSEIENIYELREILQERAARRIPLPASAILLSRFRNIHERYSEAVDKGDLRAIFRLNDEFHDTLFGSCGNTVLAEAIKKYTWLTHAIRSRVFSDSAHLARAREGHEQMINALQVGDREKLVRLCAEHLNLPKKAYIAANSWKLDKDIEKT